MKSDYHRQRSSELLDKIRHTLCEKGIKASVRLHKYAAQPDMICVSLFSNENYQALSTWEKTSLNYGLQYYLRVWDNNEKEYKDSATIWVG